MKAFKIYICISLFIIIILLGALVGAIFYIGKNAGHESVTISSKVDKFNKNINDINNNLQGIGTQLQNENAKLTRLSGGSSIAIP